MFLFRCIKRCWRLHCISRYLGANQTNIVWTFLVFRCISVILKLSHYCCSFNASQLFVLFLMAQFNAARFVCRCSSYDGCVKFFPHPVRFCCDVVSNTCFLVWFSSACVTMQVVASWCITSQLLVKCTTVRLHTVLQRLPGNFCREFHLDPLESFCHKYID